MCLAKQIDGFQDYYITTNGDVFSRNTNKNKHGRILKLKKGISRSGYEKVVLYKDTKQKTLLVHRLVCGAFLPQDAGKTYVNHINGIKTDNRLCNLEYCTQSENIKHSYVILGRKPPMLGRTGTDSPFSIPVIQIKDGCVIAEYACAYDAQRETGIPQTHISACTCGNRKTAGGFEWKKKI